MEINDSGLPPSETYRPRTISNRDLGIPEYKVRKVPKKKTVLYKKPESVIRFEIEHQAWMYRNSKSSRSTWVYGKFTDNTANGLTKLICEWFKVNGGFASRRNTTGTYSKKLGRFIKSGATAGAEDVDGTINGKNIKIEVKMKDKQRDTQKIYQKMIEDSGGVYIIVRSFDGFLSEISNHI